MSEREGNCSGFELRLRGWDWRCRDRERAAESRESQVARREKACGEREEEMARRERRREGEEDETF